MKKFAKVIRIIFMIWGLFMWAGLLAMVLVPDGRKSLLDPSSSLPPAVAILIVVAIIVFGLFLFVYNIICLYFGVDVFFQLIFHKDEWLASVKKNKALREEYRANKKKYGVGFNSKPASNRPKPATDEKSDFEKSLDSLNKKPDRRVDDNRPRHEFGWVDLQEEIKRVYRCQAWGFNAYVEIDDVYVSEDGDYDFRIEISLRLYGSATIRDSVDASRYKSATDSAVESICREINDRVSTLHSQHGFGYKINYTGLSDDVSYSDY